MTRYTQRAVRTLVVTPTLPPGTTPPAGVHARLRLFVRAAARVASPVHILHFVPAAMVDDELVADNDAASRFWGVPVHVHLCARAERRPSRWNEYGAGILSISGQVDYAPFCGPSQVRCLQQWLEQGPEVLIAHRLSSMAVTLSGGGPLPPTLFDLDDLEHKVVLRRLTRNPGWPSERLRLLQVPALIAAEWRAARRSRRTFVCSARDAQHLRRLGFGPSVSVLPNAVAMPDVPSPTGDEPSVLMLGTYAYAPNVEAADRLISNIWPLIRRKVPDARLIIAGAAPERLKSYSAHPEGVEFTGFVSDLDGLYRRAQVVCAPILNGGGTRMKLIEAAGYRKAIVSTAAGVEGLDFVPGREIEIHETDPALAESCVRLLGNTHLRNGLGEAARNRAEGLYDATAVESRIEGDIRALCSGPISKHYSQARSI